MLNLGSTIWYIWVGVPHTLGKAYVFCFVVEVFCKCQFRQVGCCSSLRLLVFSVDLVCHLLREQRGHL